MKTFWTAPIVSAAILAGCGGGEGDSVAGSFGPTEAVLGDIPAEFTASYEPTSDTVTLDDGTTSIVLPRSAANDQGIFRAYILRQGQEATVALFARTASGEGTAGVGVWSDRQIAGSAFSRQSETELPGSGTASYTGQYGGYLVGEGVSVVLAMSGDAAFTADFDAGVISGAITNRVGTGFGSFDFADLTLAETAIGSGAFTGDATGGQLLGSQFPASTTQGSYSGLFTGASGQEVVGGVAITHEDGVEVFKEYGAFVAQ